MTSGVLPWIYPSSVGYSKDASLVMNVAWQVREKTKAKKSRENLYYDTYEFG